MPIGSQKNFHIAESHVVSALVGYESLPLDVLPERQKPAAVFSAEVQDLHVHVATIALRTGSLEEAIAGLIQTRGLYPSYTCAEKSTLDALPMEFRKASHNYSFHCA